MDERDLEAEQAPPRLDIDRAARLTTRAARASALRSSAASAMWCIPGPRRARKRPTGVSSPVGVTSSIRPPPTSSEAASTPCSTSRSRCSSRASKSRSYVSIASSRSTPRSPGGGCPARGRCYPRRSVPHAAARRTIPIVSDERDSGATSPSRAWSSDRSSVSFSSSASATRSSAARCLSRYRFASS